MEWYPEEMIGDLIGALKVVAQTHFSTDETIKPLVSYLAANLHEGMWICPSFRLQDYSTLFTDTADGVASPQTVASALISPRSQNRAEQVMEAFVSILTSPACFTKFTAALPLTRICLLLLGEHPSSQLAYQVLTIISTALSVSATFSRKFELVSGWTVLTEIIPPAWDLNVHKVAFDILLGRVSGHERDKAASIFCPQMAPTIFASLRHGLQYLTTQRTGSLTPWTDGKLVHEYALFSLYGKNFSIEESTCRISARRTDELAIVFSVLPQSLQDPSSYCSGRWYLSSCGRRHVTTMLARPRFRSNVGKNESFCYFAYVGSKYKQFAKEKGKKIISLSKSC